MRLLDRYLLKNFLVPFIYCFLGFLGIWLLFDLAGNIQDFLEANVALTSVAQFYLIQLPQIVLVCLPVGVLLALLYCLGRMSRRNEIISMLGAGVSMTRVLMPLILFGLLATAVSLALSYELGPRAEGIRRTAFEELTNKRPKARLVNAHPFYNRSDRRMWYIQLCDVTDNELTGVQIIQQDADDNNVLKYHAARAVYDAATHAWNLERGKRVAFDSSGNVDKEEYFSGLAIDDWRETPWRLMSAILQPETLGVPELREYLLENDDLPETKLAPFRTNLHNRWAVPWQCLLVVLIAAPLGVGMSRRGVFGGVATAIGLFTVMWFGGRLFSTLGEGARIPAVFAAWTPIVLFALVGIYLLFMKATNREFPRFGLGRATISTPRVVHGPKLPLGPAADSGSLPAS